MLDQNFCELLEYSITKALSNSEDERTKGFWCDGVLLPDSESEYSKKTVNNKRCVIMNVFAGKTGQDRYKLTLQFGRKALSRYEKDLSLKECIPNAENKNWIDIDPESRTIAIRLD